MSGAQWVDPFSPAGLRAAVSKILTGTNYRLFYEGVTRRKLIATYRELAKIARKYPEDDDAWKAWIKKAVRDRNSNDLRYWLIGLAKKTAVNIGLRAEGLPRGLRPDDG